MVHYQALMSRAEAWRPAPGRGFAFLVTHGDHLLGLIYLASPVIRMAARDEHLGLADMTARERGFALRNYMDMSVCVGAQPIAWYWNVGKLCALIAPTLGDCIEQRFPDDEFKGIITTSLWGKGTKGTQYTRIYKDLGYTKGFGHEHVSEARYQEMMAEMRAEGVDIPSCSFGSGSNPRMRRIKAYATAFPEKWDAEFGGTPKASMNHGQKRGIYYHPAVDPATRQEVIEHWYERWGLPRYENKKDEESPYTSGTETSSEQLEVAPEN
jgi:hypothetical protein